MHTKLLFLFIAWGISLPAFSKDKKNNAATDILSYDISLKVYPDKFRINEWAKHCVSARLTILPIFVTQIN